jgi:hypothetical protein
MAKSGLKTPNQSALKLITPSKSKLSPLYAGLLLRASLAGVIAYLRMKPRTASMQMLFLYP